MFSFEDMFDFLSNRMVFKIQHGTRVNLMEHPNVITGNASVVPGAVTREWVIKAIHTRTSVAESSDEIDFVVPVWLRGIEIDGYPAISGMDVYRTSTKFFDERVLRVTKIKELS